MIAAELQFTQKRPISFHQTHNSLFETITTDVKSLLNEKHTSQPREFL